MPATLPTPLASPTPTTVVHPWLLRGVILVLGIGFALTPFYAWFSDEHPNKVMSAQHALLQKEEGRVREALEADASFQNVRLDAFEDPMPVLCISGKVRNEEELFQLKATVDCLRSKVKVSWMIVIVRNKTGEL